MKIAVAGIGYVGLSNAILLAQHNTVVAIDIVPEKVEMLNHKESPIKDTEIEDFLKHKPLNFKATHDKLEAYAGADVVFRTPILPVMAALLYLFLLPISRLIHLRRGVLQEPH